MHSARGEGRKLTGFRSCGPALAIVVAISWLAGCATGPDSGASAPVPPFGEYLSPGQSAYFGADVGANRDLISYVVTALGAAANTADSANSDAGANTAGSAGADAGAATAGSPATDGKADADGSADARDDSVAGFDIVINRVDSFVGSLSLEDPASPSFSGVAFGRLPEGITRYALWRDRGFGRSVARIDSERFVYFAQAVGSLEVAIPESGIVLVSTDSVVDMASRAHTGPTDGLDTRTSDDLSSIFAPPPRAASAPAAESGDDAAGDTPSAGAPDILIIFAEPARVISGLGLDLPRFPIERLSLGAHVSDTAPEQSGVEAATEVADSAAGLPAGARTPAYGVMPPDGVSIQLGGVFEFSSELEAALFGRLGRVFVLGFMRSLGLDTGSLRESVRIEVEGLELMFSGVTMTPEELVGLVVRLRGEQT